MAIQLEGNIEALRIYEYLTKILGTSDLANYFVLIDKSGDARAQKVSLASLLAFSGSQSQFYDNLFKLISNLDDDELTFVLDNLTTNRVLTVQDKDLTIAGLDDIITEILDLSTTEFNDTLVLAPDGSGGVEFRAESGGGGAATQVNQGSAYTTLGTLLNDSFPGTTLNATNWSGSLPTGASINNKLIIASGSAAWDRYITLNNLYVFEKLDIVIDMTVITKNSGDGWGWHSNGNLASGYANQKYIKFDQFTGILSAGNDSSANSEFVQPIDFGINDYNRSIWFSFKCKYKIIIENVTTGDKVLGEFNFCHWGTEGYYRLAFLGGQQEFNNVTISSDCRDYSGIEGIVFIGDSIGEGSGASTKADRWINRLMYNQQHLFESLCVSSVDTTHITAAKLTDMVRGIDAKYMVINLGFNDESRSIATATYQANLETLASTAQGLGYTVLMVTQFPKTYTDNSSYITAMQTAATNSGSTFINLTPYLGNTGEKNWMYDTVHPNDYGHGLIADAILQLANEFFEDILTDIDNADILFRHIGFSNEVIPLCGIDQKGRIVKLDSSKFANKNSVLLQPNLDSYDLVNQKQTGNIGITGVICNENYYHQNPGSGKGLLIGFNNGVNDNTASNILITNNGSAGIGSRQYFNAISGISNILIDALNIKGAASGAISGDFNLIMHSYIATGTTISGDNNILLQASNDITSGSRNIGIGASALKNVTTGVNNLILSSRMNYNGAAYNFSNALTGAIVIGTPFDYTGTKTIDNGDVIISAYTRTARRYIFGAWGGLSTSVEWNAGLTRGTDVNAVDLTVKGASGTGSGNSADIIFQVVTPGSTGTTPHSYNTQLTLSDGSVKVENVFKAGQFTAAQAGALTPANGDFIYVTDTDVTFTSIGFWGYENGAWAKL